MAEYEGEIRHARAEANVQRTEIEEEGTEQGQVIIGKVRDEISGKNGRLQCETAERNR